MRIEKGRFSFRIRTVVILLAVQSIFLLAYGYRLYLVNEQNYRNEFFDRIESVNRTLAVTLSPVVQDLKDEELLKIFSKIQAQNGLAYLTFHSAKRTLKVGDDAVTRVPLDDIQRRQSELKVLDHFVSLENAENIPREIYIGYDVRPLENLLIALKHQYFIGAVLMTLGLALVVFMILQLLFRRLLKIEAACTEVTKGNLETIIGDSGSDEIGRIARAFDQMTGAVRESILDRERQRVSLIEASRLSSLGTMAGGIAHEINNPLTVIQLAAERSLLLLESPESKEKIRASMERIQSTVLRIAKIVQGLRSFSRSSEGFQSEKEILTQVLDDVVSLGAERMKNLGIKFEIISSEEITLKLDRIRFGQVVLNLLNNSIDAVCENTSSDHSEGTLPVRWIKIFITRSPDGVSLRFVDSGKPLPTEIHEKIMTPFFTTKPIGQGTGLGLSISRGIVEAHGGRLFYEPQAKNTTFRIDLPASLILGVGAAATSSTSASPT